MSRIASEGLAALEVIVPTTQSSWCDCWFMGHTYVQLDDCHVARDDGQRVRCEAVEHDAARLQAALTQKLRANSCVTKAREKS